MGTVIGTENGALEAEWYLEEDNQTGPARQQKRFRNIYYVLTANLAEDPETAKLSVGIPPLGSSLNGATTVSVCVKEETYIVHPVTGVPCQFVKVEVQFDSSKKADTDLTPKVSWEGETDREALERDMITNRRIQTTAQE